MNKAKFELLAELLRSKEPVTTAARLVLLHGVPNGEASKTAGVLPQSVSRSVKAYRLLDAKIEKVYGETKKSS